MGRGCGPGLAGASRGLERPWASSGTGGLAGRGWKAQPLYRCFPTEAATGGKAQPRVLQDGLAQQPVALELEEAAPLLRQRRPALHECPGPAQLATACS